MNDDLVLNTRTHSKSRIFHRTSSRSLRVRKEMNSHDLGKEGKSVKKPRRLFYCGVLR
jgi:hypothetical protein